MAAEMLQLAQRAKKAAATAAALTAGEKNQILAAIAQALREQTPLILQENQKDLDRAEESGISPVMMDRLRLTEQRIEGIADAIGQVIDLEDPVGMVEGGSRRPNGLVITKTRVPLGVVGIIFESRPNVTVDAAALCLKSGNVAFLRGGKEAISTNLALAQIMRETIASCGYPEDLVILVEDTSRESAVEMMKLNGYLDVLIPRGGAGLIRAVVEQATVPVIETGVGNCHVYVDEDADLDMAVEIVNNAKTSRPSVCNACESLLVHRKVAADFLPALAKRFEEHHVTMYGCETTRKILGDRVLPASETEYAQEFLDYKISVKVVDSVQQAIEHVNRYTTHHSECIVTNHLGHANAFTAAVDAAAVYVNASTRFTDGGEFGLGAEIGISTQKLHARGPMGLKELTTIKYVVQGSGQIR
ncbi:MAG: glutamate-5-semialdehyde dehydrogenase [Massiliimalia sp.]|jgi:glutamate-5-semialdehyde dehydrogenase